MPTLTLSLTQRVAAALRCGRATRMEFQESTRQLNIQREDACREVWSEEELMRLDSRDRERLMAPLGDVRPNFPSLRTQPAHTTPEATIYEIYRAYNAGVSNVRAMVDELIAGVRPHNNTVRRAGEEARDAYRDFARTREPAADLPDLPPNVDLSALAYAVASLQRQSTRQIRSALEEANREITVRVAQIRNLREERTQLQAEMSRLQNDTRGEKAIEAIRAWKNAETAEEKVEAFQGLTKVLDSTPKEVGPPAA